MPTPIKVRTKLYRYTSDKTSWYFMDVSVKKVEQMLGHAIPKRRGWGQIPVRITIGDTTWKTSLFPSKEVGYLFPIKKSVRVAEGLDMDKLITAELVVQ